MKKLLIPITIFLTSCGAVTDKEYKLSKRDTSVVACLYVYNQKDLKVDLVYRLIKDTIGFTKIDEETLKRLPHRDTTYYAPVPDTLRDANGQPVKDSLGNYMWTSVYLLLPKKFFLRDLGSVNKLIDSLKNSKQ